MKLRWLKDKDRGSRKAGHAAHCRYYTCKTCTAAFHSREEAIEAGYRPCKKCRP